MIYTLWQTEWLFWEKTTEGILVTNLAVHLMPERHVMKFWSKKTQADVSMQIRTLASLADKEPTVTSDRNGEGSAHSSLHRLTGPGQMLDSLHYYHNHEWCVIICVLNLLLKNPENWIPILQPKDEFRLLAGWTWMRPRLHRDFSSKNRNVRISLFGGWI